MALKTFKKTLQKNYDYSWLRANIATRKPGFQEALLLLLEQIEMINERYELPSIADPQYRNSVKRLAENTDLQRIHAILPLIEEFKTKHNLSHLDLSSDGIPEDISMMLSVSTAPVRYIWKDNMFGSRYVDFRVDTLADLEIIKSHLALNMKVIYNARRRDNIKIPHQEFRKLHLNKATTYIKVFDMRCEKPPMPYENIVIKLQREGFYKGLGLKKAVSSARQDFSLIFEEIYGVPYKQYDIKKFKSAGIKECSICEKRSQCKELCAPIVYLLSLEEVEQKHAIGKTDAGAWGKHEAEQSE